MFFQVFELHKQGFSYKASLLGMCQYCWCGAPPWAASGLQLEWSRDRGRAMCQLYRGRILAAHIPRAETTGIPYISWVWRKYLPMMKHVDTTKAQHIRRGLQYLIRQLAKKKVFATDKTCSYFFSSAHKTRPPRIPIHQLGMKEVFTTDETCSYYFSSAHKMRTPISHTSAGYVESVCRLWNM